MGVNREITGQKKEQEKEYLYWMCSRVEGMGAVSIRKTGEFAGSFQEAFYIEGTELFVRGFSGARPRQIALTRLKKSWTAAGESTRNWEKEESAL